ncbi:MAG: PHB depolymerase family esterase [Ilumatobacter sp.]
MRSARSAFAASVLLVVAACSGGSDDASDADVAIETAVEADVDDDTADEPGDAEVETEPAETEPEPVLGDAQSDEGAAMDDADEGVADDESVDEDADPGFTIEGPARVRPACDSLVRGVNDLVLDAGGFEHDVRIYVPEVTSSDPAPVVLNWHGLGSNGPEQAAFSGYESLAEREGFVVVHATGVDVGTGPSWELQQFDTPERDDIAFADALIDLVVDDWCGDPFRVYSTGMSNGGLFTSELVCNLAGKIAAAASVAGVTHVDECFPDRPVPYVAYHGTADTVVPFGGGEPSVLLPPDAVDALIDEGTLGEFDDFAEDFECDPEPVRTEETAEVVRYDFTGCLNGVPLTFYEIVDGGHTWPSSPLADPTLGLDVSGFTFDVDATADAWAFMSQHSL